MADPQSVQEAWQQLIAEILVAHAASQMLRPTGSGGAPEAAARQPVHVAAPMVQLGVPQPAAARQGDTAALLQGLMQVFAVQPPPQQQQQQQHVGLPQLRAAPPPPHPHSHRSSSHADPEGGPAGSSGGAQLAVGSKRPRGRPPLKSSPQAGRGAAGSGGRKGGGRGGGAAAAAGGRLIVNGIDVSNLSAMQRHRGGDPRRLRHRLECARLEGEVATRRIEEAQLAKEGKEMAAQLAMADGMLAVLDMRVDLLVNSMSDPAAWRKRLALAASPVKQDLEGGGGGGQQHPLARQQGSRANSIPALMVKLLSGTDVAAAAELTADGMRGHWRDFVTALRTMMQEGPNHQGARQLLDPSTEGLPHPPLEELVQGVLPIVVNMLLYASREKGLMVAMDVSGAVPAPPLGDPHWAHVLESMRLSDRQVWSFAACLDLHERAHARITAGRDTAVQVLMEGGEYACPERDFASVVPHIDRLGRQVAALTALGTMAERDDLLCSMVALQELCLLSYAQMGAACAASFPFLPNPLALAAAARSQLRAGHEAVLAELQEAYAELQRQLLDICDKGGVGVPPSIT